MLGPVLALSAWVRLLIYMFRSKDNQRTMGDNEEKPCNFIKGLVILIYEFFFTTNLILNSMNRALASLRQTRDSARICIDKLKFVTPSNIHLVDMHEFYSF